MNRKPSLAFFSLLLLSSIVVAGRLISCTSGESRSIAHKDPLLQNNEPSNADRIARGHYIVDVSGCQDCHSPKIFTPQGTMLDSSRLLSGHPADNVLPPIDERGFKLGYWMLFSPNLTAYVGSWGITFSANLTPDSATGLGAWTEGDFIRAIRTGKHLGQEGGRPIMPPMPWSKFAKMTDEDLKSIYAYLRALPPIHNRVPAPIAPYEKKK